MVHVKCWAQSWADQIHLVLGGWSGQVTFLLAVQHPPTSLLLRPHLPLMVSLLAFPAPSWPAGSQVTQISLVPFCCKCGGCYIECPEVARTKVLVSASSVGVSSMSSVLGTRGVSSEVSLRPGLWSDLRAFFLFWI